MTQNLNHGTAKVCPTLNKNLAQKIASFVFVLIFSTGISLAAPPAELPTDMVEMAAPVSGEPIVIVLDHPIGAGASVSVTLSGEYAANFSGCSIGAYLNGSTDKIVVDLPGSGCMPSGIIPVECATITAVDAAGDVVAQYLVVADAGTWEIIEDTF